MSISAFLKTHPELEKIKKEFQTLKSYNSRFQTLMKLRPESFSGLYGYQLEKTWIKRHTKKMYLYGPHKVKIQKDCILDLAFLTTKSRRAIERGVNTFFKKNFNLQNCSYYSRDWLTFKLTNLKEIEDLKKEKRKVKRKEKGKGKVKGINEKEKGKGKGKEKGKGKRKFKRDKYRKKRRKRKYQIDASDLENENVSLTDLKPNKHSSPQQKKKNKTKTRGYSHEHEHKRKCKLGHYKNRSRNSLIQKQPKLKLKSELTSKCKLKLKLKDQNRPENTKNTQGNENNELQTHNNKTGEEKSFLHSSKIQIKKVNTKIENTKTTTNNLENKTKIYFGSNSKKENENENGNGNENDNENENDNNHQNIQFEQNNHLLDSENFDIYAYDAPNSDSGYEDFFGFDYDENENNIETEKTHNKNNYNNINQLFMIETEQVLKDGELTADIEFINHEQEDNVVISQKDLKFLKNDFLIENQMNENFENFFQNDEDFILLNEINDPLEC
ncbi:hypothetical protein M0813_26607 [Anaeramoeba flamelloides]|uniref:Uncharacterized protein n=1 Tax=Anaeramoeba flamelloides TaxID=1746091 RepID=A0ABQ8Y0N1_9EUKA|nr:hypothetical protein M0813_26607 [Anaeramoeba flamelloides]